MTETLADFETAIPRVFFAGGVNIGQDFVANSSPGQQRAWVVQGIDAYPGIQPNNGDLQVIASSDSWPIASAIIFQVQQSANFPGPFYWRGALPFLHGNFTFRVSSTVQFAFVVWGVSTYDFTFDGGFL